ncbi:hypothetical protein [Blautia sp.]|uniref:hypothetical protein n=1 Tax=Blautia sp. TaxID=1955243 RepID=UPI003A91BF2B
MLKNNKTFKVTKKNSMLLQNVNTMLMNYLKTDLEAGRIVLNVLPTVNEDTVAFTLMEAISKEYLLRRVRIYIGVELSRPR